MSTVLSLSNGICISKTGSLLKFFAFVCSAKSLRYWRIKCSRKESFQKKFCFFVGSFSSLVQDFWTQRFIFKLCFKLHSSQGPFMKEDHLYKVFLTAAVKMGSSNTYFPTFREILHSLINPFIPQLLLQHIRGPYKVIKDTYQKDSYFLFFLPDCIGGKAWFYHKKNR